ncbi:hypothetical protein AWZ03_007864 [Drosophila navojoa]|uniref:Uncharacterized protein n=1 Tax=Drosophila navojoa TaxID=7232 RepID=A0A484BA33_DRONA|nr:hypothetical protein AWZ03_007864 [Drosophila navojoa]
MLHLRLFDSSFYYTLASVSSGMLPPPQATNGSQLTLNGTTVAAPGAEATVNLTYFTPANSHVMLAPTPTTASAAQTTAATMAAAATTTAATATTAVAAAATTTSPGSDFQAAAAAAAGDNATSPYAGELDNLNSFYFYETKMSAVRYPVAKDSKPSGMWVSEWR